MRSVFSDDKYLNQFCWNILLVDYGPRRLKIYLFKLIFLRQLKPRPLSHALTKRLISPAHNWDYAEIDSNDAHEIQSRAPFYNKIC